MWSKEDLAWNTLRDSPARAKLGKQVLYAQSKAGNVLFSNELARRVEGTGIVSSSLNPGNIASDLYRWAGPFQFMTNLILYNSAQGALTSLKAATSEEGRNFNGKYLIPWARLAKPTPFCENKDVMKALWDWCEEQVSSLQ
ncbi:hypothetical protein DL96DRAFT_191125 [Flagelloscypha sp. PMI_526]|nr:hypothetical protein DL96DRAFT_191125 [Flagelloscypha sp. PMI_526]